MISGALLAFPVCLARLHTHLNKAPENINAPESESDYATSRAPPDKWIGVLERGRGALNVFLKGFLIFAVVTAVRKKTS